ncbi:MAG: phosphoheptose isomerase [Thermoplasmata archaeon]|nr:phosphoheptose isomerase [Thermoplasmata archaeon]
MLDMDFRAFLLSYQSDLVNAIESLEVDIIKQLVDDVLDVMDNGGTIHFIGNGGSSGTPSHSAGDWSKELGIKTICHTDNVSSLTAWANDNGYENVFSGALGTWAKEGDLVIGYSGSGNSKNVLNGIIKAKDLGCRTAAITGNYKGGNGGKLAAMVDVAVICDTMSMERIEDLQLIINHIVKESVKAERNLPSHS